MVVDFENSSRFSGTHLTHRGPALAYVAARKPLTSGPGNAHMAINSANILYFTYAEMNLLFPVMIFWQ